MGSLKDISFIMANKGLQIHIREWQEPFSLDFGRTRGLRFRRSGWGHVVRTVADTYQYLIIIESFRNWPRTYKDLQYSLLYSSSPGLTLNKFPSGKGSKRWLLRDAEFISKCSQGIHEEHIQEFEGIREVPSNYKRNLCWCLRVCEGRKFGKPRGSKSRKLSLDAAKVIRWLQPIHVSRYDLGATSKYPGITHS